MGSTQLRVLLLEDSPEDAELVIHHLRRDDFDIDWTRVETEEAYVEALETGAYDLVLADYTLPRIDAPKALALLQASSLEIPLIVVTGSVGEERAVALMRDGAADYLIKDRLARVGPAVRRALDDHRQRAAKKAADEEIRRLKHQLELENEYLQEEIKSSHNFHQILGESAALRETLESLEIVATTDATVLILGETGTGKELIARAIHDRSERSKRPLVKVNCAALSAQLIENELFGHERGAYTGAAARSVGRFELADGGTLFLDEIGELPIEVQAKLLRVLQEGEFERIGAANTIKVDVRIIAATNRDLEAEVAQGRFRADLFYRLNVFPLPIPPLRERRGDVGLLARFFAERFARKHKKTLVEVSPEIVATLEAYDWPGNIRELENVIERAVIMSAGGRLALEELVSTRPRTVVGNTDADGGSDSRSLVEIEAAHIRRVLADTSWRVEGPGGAAEVLGLKPGTLRSRMKKLGISRPS